MPELTEAEILTLARAAGVEIPPELVAEVGYSLNGVLEALERVQAAVPNLDEVEPLPIIVPAPPAETH